jgi:hypothetical protein
MFSVQWLIVNVRIVSLSQRSILVPSWELSMFRFHAIPTVEECDFDRWSGNFYLTSMWPFLIVMIKKKSIMEKLNKLNVISILGDAPNHNVSMSLDLVLYCS